MRRAYLFLYDDQAGTRDEVKAALNGMESVITWRFDMPNCIYVVSDNLAEELYKEFVSLNGKKGRFMFIEVTENSQGLMLSDTWYFLTNKHNKPK